MLGPCVLLYPVELNFIIRYMPRFILLVFLSCLYLSSCSNYNKYVINLSTIGNDKGVTINHSDTSYNYYIAINKDKAVLYLMNPYGPTWCDSRGSMVSQADSSSFTFDIYECTFVVDELPLELNIFRMFWGELGEKTNTESGFVMKYHKNDLDYILKFIEISPS